MPVADHDLLVAAAAVHGLTVSEYVAAVLTEKLRSEHVDQTQEGLPIGPKAT
ncbi:hypothetical protein LVY72_14005 [Arthrobacter sp. I2-34]|uniref:DUF1778 domain-containing protein n=1 Tax=Arthrobacter hankyongi TaxID=2904801 RepID=A0ABS9L8L0_9MICC|nr:hypothetical protein [Arthrobacter hankyongi]MCG2623012.1 hypothetical protein [Arthrobacter hankyongi]